MTRWTDPRAAGPLPPPGPRRRPIARPGAGSEEADPRFTRVIRWNMPHCRTRRETALCRIEQTAGLGSGILLRQVSDFHERAAPAMTKTPARPASFRRTPGPSARPAGDAARPPARDAERASTSGAAPAFGRTGRGIRRNRARRGNIQEHIEVALIQMKGETLQRVREALVRLDAGEYGYCAECEGEIAEPSSGRSPLPFAARPAKSCTNSRLRESDGSRRLRVSRWSLPQHRP